MNSEPPSYLKMSDLSNFVCSNNGQVESRTISGSRYQGVDEMEEPTQVRSSRHMTTPVTLSPVSKMSFSKKRTNMRIIEEVEILQPDEEEDHMDERQSLRGLPTMHFNPKELLQKCYHLLNHAESNRYSTSNQKDESSLVNIEEIYSSPSTCRANGRCPPSSPQVLSFD